MTRELGRFLVLEGIDGSGSTTQAERLVAELRRLGRPARFTCEPSRGPVGAWIRSVLERRLPDAEGTPVTFSHATFALLFAADRLDHVAREVVPALEGGEIVVCDRYVLSSLAYQSATAPEGDAALPWLAELNRRAPVPDATLVLEVSTETAARRRAERGGKPELFETTELQRKLAALYARAAELLPGQVVHRIDGEQGVEGVARDVRSSVASLLGLD